MVNSPSTKPEEPERARWDGHARTRNGATAPGTPSQPTTETGHPLSGRRHWAHACRDGEVVCGRVELIVRSDTRLGLGLASAAALSRVFGSACIPLCART